MAKKKTKRGFKPQPDERFPSKIEIIEGKNTEEPLPRDQVPQYDGPEKKDGPGERQKGDDKKEFERGEEPKEPEFPLDLGDMKPRRRRPLGEVEEAPSNEQYVRLRVRVRENGSLTVVDSHLVDGPLLQNDTFAGANAYEVTSGGRLIYAEPLPDLGLQRAFARPGETGDEHDHGHHFADRRTYEFSARVPAAEVTPDTIGAITVRLHRVKGEARADAITDAPLAAQFPQEMRPEAELTGLPESALPAEIESRGGRTPTP